MTATLSESAPPSGALLRHWRERRRLSQLDLAELAGTSARHLSFVETGRSRPSREIVLRLAETLDVPLRERNQMLLAAGHAPAYQEARMDPQSSRRLLETVDLLLEAHDPWPALVIDSHFDIVANNAAVDRLLSLVDPELLDPPVNVVRVTLHPRGLSRYVTNLDAWSQHLLRQVRQHAAAAPSPELDALLAEAGRWQPGARSEAPPQGPTFALTMDLNVRGQDLRLYSTVATFGTPLDVTASELAIETFLPADEPTAHWLRQAAAG